MLDLINASKATEEVQSRGYPSEGKMRIAMQM